MLIPTSEKKGIFLSSGFFNSLLNIGKLLILMSPMGPSVAFAPRGLVAGSVDPIQVLSGRFGPFGKLLSATARTNPTGLLAHPSPQRAF